MGLSLSQETCAGSHLSRTDGLTQLTGDTALLSTGVAAEGVLSTETCWQRALLKWVVDGSRFTEQITHGHSKTCREMLAKNRWETNYGFKDKYIPFRNTLIFYIVNKSQKQQINFEISIKEPTINYPDIQLHALMFEKCVSFWKA